jgi:hypothetical protein
MKLSEEHPSPSLCTLFCLCSIFFPSVVLAGVWLWFQGAPRVADDRWGPSCIEEVEDN